MDYQRRLLLKAGAGAAGAALFSGTKAAESAPPVETMPGNKPGDFDFLTGSWKIAHRQRKGAGWDEFVGEATVWPVLGGVGSIEELRIPSRNFSGCGIRFLDMEKRLWADHWVNARSGIVNLPMWGGFENGIGTWLADDLDGDKPIKAKGVWDRITPVSCRWYQAVSRDGGKTWDETWLMDWRRA